MAAPFRRTLGKLPVKYKSWLKMIQDKSATPDDAASVSALASVCDFYGVGIPETEIKAKNNFEIKWEDWGHIATPGLVSKLKAKVEEINAEEYEADSLAMDAMNETEELKTLRHIVTWNAAVNLHYIAEQDSLLENLYHAKPMESLNYWEFTEMWKYDDVASRWDNELGWYMPNNDQVSEDPVFTNKFQFQKDFSKIALMRYYYDWMGRHHVLCTVGKLSQTEKED